ncbi:hypothetical protein ABFY60_00600 [Lysinibacillus pakistanensis]|uniref:hypothetical protein n=1 Tax=Lysinibacillus pakistanensis TaxID=759811 RepID=UPI003D28995C
MIEPSALATAESAPAAVNVKAEALSFVISSPYWFFTWKPTVAVVLLVDGATSPRISYQQLFRLPFSQCQLLLDQQRRYANCEFAFCNFAS